MIPTVLVFPTFRCGLGCPYCGYKVADDNKSVWFRGSGETIHIEKELSVDQWIKLLSEFGDGVFEFSGGEPFRYKGIAKVLNSLPRWSVTSNTLLLDKESVDFSKCYMWTASFHPHIASETEDLFIENINYIRGKSIPVAVTLVVQPQTIARTFLLADKFNDMGFMVNIHPYYDDPDFDWDDYPREKRALKKNPFLRYDESLMKLTGLRGVKECSGGKSYFVLAPDGRMYRCLTDMLFGEEPITGASDSEHKCEKPCMFPCDWYYGIKGRMKKDDITE